MLAAQADGSGRDDRGRHRRGEIADLQAAFLERNALQCGYLHARHAAHRRASCSRTTAARARDEIRTHLSGNYCRCTGYQAIVDADRGGRGQPRKGDRS